MIRSVIIEDETKTREGLVYMLNKYCPDVEIIATAGDFEQGFNIIRDSQPSLIFVDIQLNSQEGTGLELISTLTANTCAVIFISGYKDYAVDAFRLKAVDYLLKPIRINHLVDAVDKAKKYLSPPASGERESPVEAGHETFHIPTQNGIVIIRQHDIIRCEADGAYTHFYLQGKKEKITSSINIGQIELKLGANLMRVHKSHIINRKFVESYSKGEGLIVRMSDLFSVPVSRNQRETFFNWLD